MAAHACVAGPPSGYHDRNREIQLSARVVVLRPYAWPAAVQETSLECGVITEWQRQSWRKIFALLCFWKLLKRSRRQIWQLATFFYYWASWRPLIVLEGEPAIALLRINRFEARRALSTSDVDLELPIVALPSAHYKLWATWLASPSYLGRCINERRSVASSSRWWWSVSLIARLSRSLDGVR